MKTNVLLLLGVLGTFVVGGCGKKASGGDDDDRGSGGSVSAGSGGAAAGRDGTTGGAVGSGGSSNEPPISSAPAAWTRPDDCGGIGDRCADILGCGSLSSCQLVGDVCIPKLEEGATSLPGRTAETPYCAAYTCMTFEEASCFCTGEAGTQTPSCSSPSALAGLCAGEDTSCATKACCDGLSCVEVGSSKSCVHECSDDSECSTGCCTDRLDIGVPICSDLEACTNPCKKRGEACTQGSSTTSDDCCRGACVESENDDFAGCRPICTTNADCPETGCCVPFSNSSNGFCADALYCSCTAAAEPCGPDRPTCCEGTICAGQSADTLTCRTLCTDDSDCAPASCRALSDDSAKICDEACSPVGASCSSTLACCSGLTCAGFDPDFNCYPSCARDDDCASGYCTLYDSGAGACLDDVVGG
jgi:hypothetical protein